MKKRAIFAIILFLSLTTIVSKQKLEILNFDIKQINVENNYLVQKKDIKDSLNSFYGKNIIFLKTKEIEKALMKNSYIESFNLKKKYPSTLSVKIFEKKPIAIIQIKKNKYYLSENIDLFEYKKIQKFESLPYVFGDHKKFKIFYEDLKKIDFPLRLIKTYTLYDINRWDLETFDNNIIKLSPENYIQNLQNYLQLKNKKSFHNYSSFDYRIQDQLILK